MPSVSLVRLSGVVTGLGLGVAGLAAARPPAAPVTAPVVRVLANRTPTLAPEPLGTVLGPSTLRRGRPVTAGVRLTDQGDRPVRVRLRVRPQDADAGAGLRVSVTDRGRELLTGPVGSGTRWGTGAVRLRPGQTATLRLTVVSSGSLEAGAVPGESTLVLEFDERPEASA